MNKVLAEAKPYTSATTVIEVGVNVPNASVMITECRTFWTITATPPMTCWSSVEQSCILLMQSHKLSNDSKPEWKPWYKLTISFEIAEVDLKLRGPGDIMGTQQSGVLNSTNS
jgi:ATP-dependent DNA helicase RecG